jgi:PST family polysaccharide transporter
MALALIGAALVLVLAPFFASLYGAPEIEGLAAVAAFAMPFSALSLIPMTAIRAGLNFRLLAMVGTAELIATQLLTIVLAWYGMGPYSFVIPFPLMAAVKAAWLWAIVQPRMRPARPRRAWWYLIRSSLWIWVFRLLVALVSQGDYFVLGLLAPRQEVGFYFFAFRLAFQPPEALAANLQAVLFPVLAQLRSRPEEQYHKALKSSEYLAAVVFFVGYLQAALASPLLHLIFHDRWNGSIVLLQVLSLAAPLDSVPWIAGALLEARGEFRTRLIRLLVASPWFFILVALGAWLDNAFGVAIGVGVYYAIFGPWYSYLAMRSDDIGLSSIIRIYIWPILLSGSAVSAAWAVTHFLNLSNVAAIQILFISVMATGLYASLLRASLPGTFFAVRNHVTSIFLKSN